MRNGKGDIIAEENETIDLRGEFSVLLKARNSKIEGVLKT